MLVVIEFVLLTPFLNAKLVALTVVVAAVVDASVALIVGEEAVVDHAGNILKIDKRDTST